MQTKDYLLNLAYGISLVVTGGLIDNYAHKKIVEEPIEAIKCERLHEDIDTIKRKLDLTLEDSLNEDLDRTYKRMCSE